MNTSAKRIIVGVLALCVVVGFAVPAATQTISQTIPPPRYQVIDDMLTMQQRIDRLERDLSNARDEIGVLHLLRAHDIEARARERAEDQKRIAALETFNRMCR